MWILNKFFHICGFVLNPKLLVVSFFCLKIFNFFGSHIGGSVFVTGIDVDILSAEGPDMGDIIVDSIFNSHIDEDEEIGESLPRKLYNYFFGSKNSPKRRRRSANIRPEPVYRPSKSAVPKRNINKLDVRKAYKTPRQALAEVTYDEGENTISLVPRNHGKRARNVRKIRPPPPPFVEVGNQTYRLSFATSQKLTTAIKEGLPQPPPPYLYEKFNASEAISDSSKLTFDPFDNRTRLNDIGDTPIGINYKDVSSNSLETIEDERFKRQNNGNTTEAPTVYRYRTYKPPSTFYGDSYTSEEYEDYHHLPYKYPYKYQHGRHVKPGYFTIPCETCEPYEDNRDKLPRLLLPWPLTLYTKDRQRPFPDNTYLLFTPMLLVPFVPFGLTEFSLPMGFEANYVVERFNGFKDDVFGVQIGEALPPVKKKREAPQNDSPNRIRRSNFAEDQFDILEAIGDLFTNTFAINGKGCMQRLICEIAEVPVSNLSFMSRILHDIIMPLKADDHRQNDDVEDFERSLGLLSDYADAERHGKNTGQCGKRYGMCPFSIHSILPKEYVHQHLMANRIKRR